MRGSEGQQEHNQGADPPGWLGSLPAFACSCWSRPRRGSQHPTLPATPALLPDVSHRRALLPFLRLCDREGVQEAAREDEGFFIRRWVGQRRMGAVLGASAILLQRCWHCVTACAALAPATAA